MRRVNRARWEAGEGQQLPAGRAAAGQDWTSAGRCAGPQSRREPAATNGPAVRAASSPVARRSHLSPDYTRTATFTWACIMHGTAFRAGGYSGAPAMRFCMTFNAETGMGLRATGNEVKLLVCKNSKLVFDSLPTLQNASVTEISVRICMSIVS